MARTAGPCAGSMGPSTSSSRRRRAISSRTQCGPRPSLDQRVELGVRRARRARLGLAVVTVAVRGASDDERHLAEVSPDPSRRSPGPSRSTRSSPEIDHEGLAAVLTLAHQHLPRRDVDLVRELATVDQRLTLDVGEQGTECSASIFPSAAFARSSVRARGRDTPPSGASSTARSGSGRSRQIDRPSSAAAVSPAPPVPPALPASSLASGARLPGRSDPLDGLEDDLARPADVLERGPAPAVAPCPRYSTAATAASPPSAASPTGPPTTAASTIPGAMPWLGLGPRRCNGRLSKSRSAGSTVVRPGTCSSPIDSRWASAAPQLAHVVASGAAGAAHQAQVRGVSGVPGSVTARRIRPGFRAHFRPGGRGTARRGARTRRRGCGARRGPRRR